MSISETDAFGRQLIQMRCFVGAVFVVGRQVAVAEVIGVDDQDVGQFVRGDGPVGEQGIQANHHRKEDGDAGSHDGGKALAIC